MLFKDKTIVITGAGSGIGRATALHFAQEGAQVIVSDRNEAGGQETVQYITETGGLGVFIQADVSDYAQVQHLIAETIRQFGKLDVAVNNAGLGPKRMARTAEHTIEDWNRVIAVNQTGVFYCMQLELLQMQAQGYGAIVNVASMAGLKGLQNNVAYTASKHAVIGMTKVAALEYAKQKIRVNAVCPVFTQSPLLDKMLSAKAGMDVRLKMAIPMQRFGEAEEVAQTIAWLASDAASFITGTAVPIDGGSMA